MVVRARAEILMADTKPQQGCVVSVQCDYRIFDKQYNIPAILFFTLGIMHKKLIFIYIMTSNVWEKSI